MGKVDKLFDGSNAHLLNGEEGGSSAGYAPFSYGVQQRRVVSRIGTTGVTLDTGITYDSECLQGAIVGDIYTVRVEHGLAFGSIREGIKLMSQEVESCPSCDNCETTGCTECVDALGIRDITDCVESFAVIYDDGEFAGVYQSERHAERAHIGEDYKLVRMVPAERVLLGA